MRDFPGFGAFFTQAPHFAWPEGRSSEEVGGSLVTSY